MFRIFIDGREGTTGLEIQQRLAGRQDLELLEIDINDCEYYYDEEEGGFLLFDSTYSPAAEQTLYGGLYYCDDTCIVAMTFDEADYDSIDELLYILNLPTP